MTFSIYQYFNVSHGNPVEPPSVRTAAQAFDADVTLGAATRYVAVCAQADMHLRIGGTPTTDDHKILAGETRGFPVLPGIGATIRGTAA